MQSQLSLWKEKELESHSHANIVWVTIKICSGMHVWGAQLVLNILLPNAFISSSLGYDDILGPSFILQYIYISTY